MICYFDTSAFLKLVIVTEEGASEAALLWDGAERVVSSVLLYPEGRAALARFGRGAVHLSSAETVADPTLVLVAADRALIGAARRIGLGVAEIGP